MGKYEISKFGNGVLVGSGGNVTTNVHNHYGTRDSGQTVGVANTGGSNELEFQIELTGEMINRFTNNDEFLMTYKLLAGFKIEAVYARTKEVFVVTGTTPAVEVGTEGSEATNGFTITEAQLETLGTYDLTGALSGTWAAPINADTTVGIALSGTSPVVTDAGKMDIIIKLTRVA